MSWTQVILTCIWIKPSREQAVNHWIKLQYIKGRRCLGFQSPQIYIWVYLWTGHGWINIQGIKYGFVASTQTGLHTQSRSADWVCFGTDDVSNFQWLWAPLGLFIHVETSSTKGPFTCLLWSCRMYHMSVFRIMENVSKLRWWRLCVN